LEALEVAQREPTVAECLGEIRFERERVIVACDRLLVAPQSAQRIAATVVHFCVTRLDAQRVIVACERVLRPVQLVQDIAAVAQRRRVVGFDREHLVVA
jgi:hypothetical protein